MKTLNFKKIIVSALMLVVLLTSSLSLVACKDKTPPQNDELNMENGVHVVIDEAEFSSLLAQAKLNHPTKNIKLVNSNKYSKADILLVINQIKENIESSTAIGGYTSYNYDGYPCEEIAVVTQTERYTYSKQLDKSGKQLVAEYHSWTKNESGQLIYYEKAFEEGVTRKTRHEAEPYLNNNGVYDFCQGKFTFTCKDLTEDDIESFKNNKNKIYIKIKTSIYHDVESDLEVQEIFQVKKGKIVQDRLIWSGLDMTINYTFDNDVDLTKLDLPENETWE